MSKTIKQEIQKKNKIKILLIIGLVVIVPLAVYFMGSSTGLWAIAPSLTPILNDIETPTGNDVFLDWNDVPDAIKYHVYKSTNGYSFIQLNTIRGSSEVTIYNLADGTYYFKIIAKSTTQVSSFSNVKSVIVGEPPIVVILPPKAPVLKSIRYILGTDGNFKVDWDFVNGIDSYVLYRSKDGAGFAVRQITTSSVSYFNEVNLADGTYTYKVRTYTDAGGYSDYSNSKSVVVDSTYVVPVPLNAPVLNNIILIPVSNDVSLNWNDVTNAIKYNIWQSTDGSNYNLIDTVFSSDYNVINLADGTYWYKITSVSLDNLESDDSNVESVTYVESVAPNAPILEIILLTNNNDINLDWNDVNGAEKYHVYESNDNIIFTFVKTVMDSNHIILNSDDGTYYYEITAENIDGLVSDYSNMKDIIIYTVLDPTDPDPEEFEIDNTTMILLGVFGVLVIMILIFYMRKRKGISKRIK